MNQYKLFPMRFPNNCLTCGKRLEQGTQAYGLINEATRKWSFFCVNCHEKTNKPETIPTPKISTGNPDGSVETVIEMLGDLQMTEDNEPGISNMAEVAAQKKNRLPTLLELIRQNAPFGIPHTEGK